MTTRRAFLTSLLALASAPFAPTVQRPVWHVGRDCAPIPMRKIMARIRITEEAMADIQGPAFIKASQEEWAGIAQRWMAEEDAFLGHDARSRLPL